MLKTALIALVVVSILVLLGFVYMSIRLLRKSQHEFTQQKPITQQRQLHPQLKKQQHQQQQNQSQDQSEPK